MVYYYEHPNERYYEFLDDERHHLLDPHEQEVPEITKCVRCNERDKAINTNYCLDCMVYANFN